MPTTILVEPDTRARLKRFGTHGMTYNDILNKLMDEAEKARFFDEIYRDLASTPERDMVSLDELDEDFLPRAASRRPRGAAKPASRSQTRASGRASGAPARSRKRKA